MDVALVKTSSLGDVIHALPVASDIAAARPDVRFDWIVEESLADLPRLHPAVRDVIPVAIRRWRRRITLPSTWAEIRAARARLRAGRYEFVLDLQGLVKSAWVARWAGAPVAGYSRAFAREPVASFAYARRFDVDARQHAIERMRSLAAQALGYAVQGPPRFGLAVPPGSFEWLGAPRYAVMLHATARAEKQWPRASWVALGTALSHAGVASVLPWGNALERDAARSLAGAIPGAIVAPRISLADCARLLAGAEAVVGVDTGLTHLAAALDARTVALFSATPAWRYGPYWSERAKSLGDEGRPAAIDEVLATLALLGVAGLR